jgi:hypothetical protein
LHDPVTTGTVAHARLRTVEVENTVVVDHQKAGVSSETVKWL